MCYYLHFMGKGEAPWPMQCLKSVRDWAYILAEPPNSEVCPLSIAPLTIQSVHTNPKSRLVFLKIWCPRTICIRSPWEYLLKMQTPLPDLWPIAPESQIPCRQFFSFSLPLSLHSFLFPFHFSSPAPPSLLVFLWLKLFMSISCYIQLIF